MAVNLSNYIKNIGKSVGYSAIDKVKAMNPTISNMVKQNEDLTKDLYKNVKNYKSLVKNIPSAIKGNEYYKISEQAIKNTLEDISTGKFYNKERINKSYLNVMGFSEDDLNIDIDFDFNLDDDFGLNDLDLDSIGDDDIFLANEMDEVGSKVSNAVASSTIQSANYLAEVNKASTKLLLDQNTKMMAQMTTGMGAINTSVQELIKYQENIQTHIENSTKFYTTIGEKVDTTNKILSELLELQKENNSIKQNEERKSSAILFSDIDDGMGGVDLKLYAKNVKKRLKNQMGGITDMLHFGGGGNMLETFIASPLQFITDNLVDKVISKSIKEANRNLDESVKGLFGSLMARANNMADSENGILQKIGEILGVTNRLKRNIDTSNYNKGPMPWNGKANKALVEVIPTQLSEIISILNGQSQKLFDYENGKFTTREAIAASKDSELEREAYKAGRDVMDELKGIMSKMSFDTQKERETLLKEMSNMFTAVFKHGEFLDIYNKDYDLPGVVDPDARRYLKSMLKNVSRNKMLTLNTNILEGRDRYTKKMQEIELSGNSVYNYLEDNFNSDHLSYKRNGDRKEIDTSKDKSILARLSIDRVKDNLGHNIFYYLQNINSELSYIRSNGGMGGGNGGYPPNIYYSPSGILYGEPDIEPFSNSIVDDSERTKENKYKQDREIENIRRYEEKKKKEREQNRNLTHTEDLNKLEDKEFDRAISAVAEEYRISDKGYGEFKRTLGTPKQFIDSLLKAQTLSEKSKVIVENVKDIAKQPSQLIAAAMDSADRALYTIIYGDKRDKDGKRKSFLNELIEQMKLQFMKFNTWLDTTILNPIKEKLEIESFKDIPQKIFSMFGINLDETVKSFKEFIFGSYYIDSNGNKVMSRSGLLTPIAEGIEETFDGFGKFLDDALDPIIGTLKNKFKGTKVEQAEDDTEDDETSSSSSSSSSSTIVTTTEAAQKITKNNKKNTVDEDKEIHEYNKNAKVKKVDTSNSYNLAGGFLRNIDYKNIDKEIDKQTKLSRKSRHKRNNKAYATLIEALNVEKEKYETFSSLFGELLQDKKEGARAAHLFLNKVGSRNEDATQMSLEQIYEDLKDLGETLAIIKKDGKQVGLFSNSYKGKQLIDRFNMFADQNTSVKGRKSKITDVLETNARLGIPNNSFVNAQSPKNNVSNDITNALKEQRETKQKDLEFAFSQAINGSSNETVKELKSIHGTLKNILRHMPGGNYNTTDSGIIVPNGNGPLMFSEGGVVDYPEDAVIPALLSGGEIVINPADEKTRKEQGKREKRVMDLFKNGKIRLLSEGTTDSEGNPVPLDESEEEIKIGRKTYKLYEHGGEKYIYTKNVYYKVEEFKEKGKKSVKYKLIDDKMVKVDGPRKAKDTKFVHETDKPEYVEGEEPLTQRVIDTASDAIKDTVRALGITKDDSDKFNNAVKDVIDNISEYAPVTLGGGLIGGGVSLITGAIGGPLLGAAAGAAVSLVQKSSKVQSWLFGDQDENGEYDGGFLSKELSNNIHKYLPGMAKSATLGGILSILPFAPSPIIGIMLGSAVGYAKNNEEFMSTIFGENYKDNIGNFKEKLNEKLPNLILGAGAGALFGPLGGIIPNIMLGSAVGFASTTEKFKSLLFGEEQEDGTRQGGILNAVKVGIVDPIKENGKALWDDIRNWVHDDIITPIKDSISPLFKQTTMTISKIFGFVSDKLFGTFDKGITYAISNFLQSKVFSPIIGAATKTAEVLFNPAKNAISLPFRMVGKVGDHFRGKHVAGGNATYMSAQERLDYRQERRQRKQNGFFGRMGTAFNKITGTESNPLSRFISNRKAINKDRFEDFDEFLTSAKDEELGQMLDQFNLISDTEGYLKKEESQAYVNQRKAIYNSSLNFSNANEIDKALLRGDYAGAKHALDKADIDEFDRQQLANKIFSAGTKLNSVRQAVENITTGRTDVLRALRNHSSGVFKGLKSEKDITKYQKYLTDEIGRRKKSDVEIQTDQQQKHHEQIMDILGTTVSYLRTIAEPDSERRKKQLELIENKERMKAASELNTKAGLFGNFGVRSEKARLMDVKRDEDGNIIKDEMGNPIMEYVGYGTMEHAKRNMDLYETTVVDNKRTLVLDRNGRPKLKSNMKTNSSNLFNTLNTSRYKKQELFDKYSTKYTLEDMVNFNNHSHDELKEKLKHYASKYNIENVDLDRELLNTSTDKDLEKLLKKLQFNKWTRKDREEFDYEMNQANNRKFLRDRYGDNEDKIESQLSYFNNIGKGKKKHWYMFEGSKRYKLTLNNDGEPEIDNTDSETSENIEDVEKANAINKETRDILLRITDFVGGHIKRFFGIGDYRDSDKETLWDKLNITTGKVLGAWTLVSFMPHIKKFWMDTAAPFLGNIMAPLAPTLEKVSLKLDNFFMNTVPNTLKDIGNNIIWWLSGTGKYKDAGLPGVFKNHIIPFYMGGLEFVTEDIVPLILNKLPNILGTAIRGGVKYLSNLLSTNVAHMLRGEVPTLENEMEEKLDNGVFESKTNTKTGPFYAFYRSMFGTSSSISTPTNTGIVTYDSNQSNVYSTKSKNKVKNSKSSSNDNYTSYTLTPYEYYDENTDMSQVDENSIYVSKQEKKKMARLLKEYSNINTGNSYNNSSIEYADPDFVEYSSPENSVTDYQRILESTNKGDAMFTADGNLVYNTSNGLIEQDAYGNLYSITPTTSTNSSYIINDSSSDQTNNSSLMSDLGKIPSSLVTRGTIGHAGFRSFMTRNAGLASSVANRIRTKGYLIPKGKGITRIVTTPINSLAKHSSNIIKKAADAGDTLYNFSQKKWLFRPLQSTVDDVVTKNLLELGGNGTLLYDTGKLKLQYNSMSDVADALKNMNYSEERIVASMDNIERKVAESISRQVSSETNEIALREATKSRLEKIATNSWFVKVFKTLGTNFSETELVKKMVGMTDEITDSLIKRLLNKGVSKIGTFLGKLSPISLVFIGLDAARGWANAQANLGVMRAPTLPERFISAIVTVINGYLTLGLLPETLIYKIVIECIGPIINLGDDLLEEREAAEREVAEYNTKYGTDYTVSEYINKDRTGISKLLFGGGKKEATTTANDTMNVALNNSYITGNYSSIIGGSLSEQQLQYAKDNGLYAAGTGLVARGIEENKETYTTNTEDYSSVSDVTKNIQDSSFVSQLDPNTYDRKTNWATSVKAQQNTISNRNKILSESGCVPAVAAMMVSELNSENQSNESIESSAKQNYKAAYQMAFDKGYVQNNGAIKTDLIEDYLKLNNIESTKYSNSKASSSWVDEVKKGNSVAVIGKDPTNSNKSISPFGKHSHAVRIRGLIKGTDGKEDQFIVDDPESLKGGTLYSKSKIMNAIQEVIIPKTLKSKNDKNNKENIIYDMFNSEVIGMQYADLCTFSTISKSTFKTALGKFIKGIKNSQFKKKSDIFLIASQVTGLDPRFLLAVALYMTNYGTNKYATTYKNPFKIRNKKKKVIKFLDLEDGIIEGAKYIKSQMYLNGKYCLRQMAISDSSEIDSVGITSLEITVSELPEIVDILLSKKMPKNTKFASYLEGPTDSAAPSATITGERVYNSDGNNGISSISDMTALFTKLMNAIYGFSSESDDPYKLNQLQDNDDGESSKNSNGHSFMCYCQECHPEMYDKDGNPITAEAQNYIATKQALEQTKLNEATNKVASQIYDTLVSQLDFPKNLDPIKLINSTTFDYRKSPVLADKMAKFTIMASQDSTVPGIRLVNGNDITTDFYDLTKPLEITKDNANLEYSSLVPNYLYQSLGIANNDAAIKSYISNSTNDGSDYKSVYNSLCWYYKDNFGENYKPSRSLSSDSDYKNEISVMKSTLLKRLKITDKSQPYSDTTLYNYLTGKTSTSVSSKLGYDYNNLAGLTDNYYHTGRSLLEKTSSFNPTNIGNSKLRLYPVTKSNEKKPLYYLAEGYNLDMDNLAFKTNLLGIPVYGYNKRTTTGADEYMKKNGYWSSVAKNVGTTISGIFSKETDEFNDWIYTKDRSWGDLTTEDMVSVYGLSKASNILDQYLLQKQTSSTEEESTNTKDQISGVVDDGSATAYSYDENGNLSQYDMSTTDLSAQGSGLKYKFGQGSFVSQLDPQYSNIRFNTSKDSKVQTLGEAGCAPAVATMAINNYLGNGTNMIDMANSALNYKVKDGGTSSDYFEDVFAQNGISSSYTNSTSEIKNSLKNGHSVVLLGRDSSNTSKENSPFGPGNHYVLANGISKDGRTIYVNDPELDSENVTYNSSILKNTNLGISVGGSSRLIPSLFSGGASYTKENATVKQLRARNLGYFSQVTAEQLNKWINSKCSKSSLMYNTGKYFIKASNKSGLDPRYIVAHAAHETGWGTSDICRDKYNFFGISAFDASPYASASKWDGVEQGIVSGAVWISKNYYAKGQTTLYTMRHNNGSHQYATDAEWDIKIAKIMQGGPINTEFTEVKSILAKADGSYSSDTSDGSTGEQTYSSFSDMISSVFGNLSNAIFGFSSNSIEDYESAGEETEAVTESKSKVRYINQKTNMYKGKEEPISGAPEASKNIIMELNVGDKVKVIVEYKKVSQVKKSGKLGYVLNSVLQKDKPEVTETSTSNTSSKKKKNTEVRYIKNNTKMYKYKTEPISGAPEASKNILLDLKKGDKVNLIKDLGTVSKISKSNKTGFIKSSFLYESKEIKDLYNKASEQSTNAISRAISSSKSTTKTPNITLQANPSPDYGKKNQEVYASGSGSGLVRNKSKFYAKGSKINKSSYAGNGIEEIFAPFNKLGNAIFGFNNNSSSTDSSSSNNSTSTVTRKKYNKEHKKFILTNDTSEMGERIVAEAKKHLGKPYKWGANGPKKFDCSGLCVYVYKQCGIQLKNRHTATMASDSQGKVVTKASVGDLVYFGPSVAGIKHMGIYIGDGKYIHAPQTGDVVKISDLTSRNDLVRIKHYSSSGKGSGLSLTNKLNTMANINLEPAKHNNALNNYIENAGSSKIKETNTTRTIIQKESSIDNTTILELIKLCCKYMSKTADNTDSMKDIVTLLTKLVDAKQNKKQGKGSTIKVEHSGKGSSKENMVIINNKSNSTEDKGTEELIELLTRLASD